MSVDIAGNVDMYPAGLYRSNTTFYMESLKWELILEKINYSGDKGDF